MIDSLFVLNSSGKIIIEKHWRGLINRQIVDYFNDQVSNQTSSEDVLPIISTPKYQLVHVYRSGLTFLSPVTNEVDALLVLEFLHRIVDILAEYFGEIAETSIKDNFDTVYQLLEEMMDYGKYNEFRLALEIKNLWYPLKLITKIHRQGSTA
ncbi:1908_t:CDS:2, partial [Acaulospora colombiana]